MREVTRTLARAAVVLLIAIVAACGGGAKKPPATGKPRPTSVGVQEGLATFYGGKFHGKPTASGEPFNKNAFTAAHRKLRFGTRVRVTNKRNGRTVEVRINDRGPFGRAIIDLSEAAARQLNMIEAGVVPVRIEILK